MFAILPTLGTYELLLLLVIGLLLYGRNLPQAGRTMGRFVAQLKRGFHDFKEQMDRDESLREVRKTFEDTTREMRNLTAVPRAIANPVNELRNLARDAVTAPVSEPTNETPDPDELQGPPAPDGLHEPHEPPAPPPVTDPETGGSQLPSDAAAAPPEPPVAAGPPPTDPTPKSDQASP